MDGYSYDSNGALTAATQKTSGGTLLASYGYGHDNAGNLTSTTTNGNSTTLTYNAADQLTQATGATNASYTYDGNGDLVSRSDGLTITQNAQDQLTSITPPGGSAINMAYTGLGEGRRTGAGSNRYQYDATGISLQTAGANPANFTNLPGGGLLSETVSGSTYYYLSDGAGNVAGLCGPSGTLTNSYAYDPLGNIVSKTEGVSNPFTFHGWQYDSGSGLYYTGSSGYYDPATGMRTGCQDLGPQDSFSSEDFCGEDELAGGSPYGSVASSSKQSGGGDAGDAGVLHCGLGPNDIYAFPVKGTSVEYWVFGVCIGDPGVEANVTVKVGWEVQVGSGKNKRFVGARKDGPVLFNACTDIPGATGANFVCPPNEAIGSRELPRAGTYRLCAQVLVGSKNGSVPIKKSTPWVCGDPFTVT